MTMNDYELDDFKNDEFGEFERYNNENCGLGHTSVQLIEMFTKSPSNLIWFDEDDDYDDDIPY